MEICVGGVEGRIAHREIDASLVNFERGQTNVLVPFQLQDVKRDERIYARSLKGPDSSLEIILDNVAFGKFKIPCIDICIPLNCRNRV